MASSNSPCAACKVRRCKCTQECVFAPYFPPDQPQKFANVHNVFGASNVAKLLNELDARHREDAVNSLAYEAEFRLRDPVYGCVGLISLLQQRLKEMQGDLLSAKKELAGYIGPQAMVPAIHPSPVMMLANLHQGNPSSSSAMPYNTQPLPYNMQPMMPYNPPAGLSGQLMIRDPHQLQQHQLHQQQQQMFEAQQLAAAAVAREQQDMLRAFEQKEQQMDPTHHHPQLQQQELLRLHNGFDPSPASGSGFHQLNDASLSPSLALGTFDNGYHLDPEVSEHPHSHYHHQQQQLHAQPLLQPQLQLQAQPLLQPQHQLQAQPSLQPQQQIQAQAQAQAQAQPQPLLQPQQPSQPPTRSQLLQQQQVDSEDDSIIGPSG